MIALDTNILIYAVAREPAISATSALAQSIMMRAARSECIVPVQVLAEFANACRRKNILAADLVRARIGEIAATFITPVSSAEDVDRAAAMAERYRLQFFDALICAVANRAGAKILLSEDFQDGMVIGDLAVLNPLSPANAGPINQLLPDL